MNRELVRTVMGYLGNQRGRWLWTCSAELATSLPLARTGALAGIEASDEAVEMARRNARVNVEHASAFYAEDLYGEGGALHPIADKNT